MTSPKRKSALRTGGFSPARLARIRGLLGRAADRGEIAGAVTLVVRHGSGIDQDSFALAHQAIDD